MQPSQRLTFAEIKKWLSLGVLQLSDFIPKKAKKTSSLEQEIINPEQEISNIALHRFEHQDASKVPSNSWKVLPSPQHQSANEEQLYAAILKILQGDDEGSEQETIP